LVKVFVIKSKEGESNKYINTKKRVFPSFDDFIKDNDLPEGHMIYPKNGTYTPSQDEKMENKVVLISSKTSGSILRRTCEGIITMSGTCLMFFGPVSLLPIGGLSKYVAFVLEYGTYIVSAASIVK
jgi:hypothetical protein